MATRRGFLARLVEVSMLAVGAMVVGRRVKLWAVPSFTLIPDPPVAGQDVVVIYNGNNPGSVEYRVGSSDSIRPTMGSNNKFTIPKNELDKGLKLIVEDTS
ncbi:MAG: hypothetical protein QGG14_08685, partial [Planctomycetota bacterium]|nr:hypothetical protein [Planctomycetota bacterium]